MVNWNIKWTRDGYILNPKITDQHIVMNSCLTDSNGKKIYCDNIQGTLRSSLERASKVLRKKAKGAFTVT